MEIVKFINTNQNKDEQGHAIIDPKDQVLVSFNNLKELEDLHSKNSETKGLITPSERKAIEKGQPVQRQMTVDQFLSRLEIDGSPVERLNKILDHDPALNMRGVTRFLQEAHPPLSDDFYWRGENTFNLGGMSGLGLGESQRFSPASCRLSPQKAQRILADHGVQISQCPSLRLGNFVQKGQFDRILQTTRTAVQQHDMTGATELLTGLRTCINGNSYLETWLNEDLAEIETSISEKASFRITACPPSDDPPATLKFDIGGSLIEVTPWGIPGGGGIRITWENRGHPVKTKSQSHK